MIVYFDSSQTNALSYARAREILSVFLYNNMLHVKLIIPDDKTDVLKDVTWLPFDNKNCASKLTKLIPIGRCDCSSTGSGYQFIEYPSAQRPVIPRRLTDCKLRISASLQEPYVRYNRSSRIIHGFEVTLVKNIAIRMGMQPKIAMIKEERSNRDVTGNRTGIYSKLFNR